MHREPRDAGREDARDLEGRRCAAEQAVLGRRRKCAGRRGEVHSIARVFCAGCNAADALCGMAGQACVPDTISPSYPQPQLHGAAAEAQVGKMPAIVGEAGLTPAAEPLGNEGSRSLWACRFCTVPHTCIRGPGCGPAPTLPRGVFHRLPRDAGRDDAVTSGNSGPRCDRQIPGPGRSSYRSGFGPMLAGGDALAPLWVSSTDPQGSERG